MAHSIEITPIDDQIPLLLQTEKDHEIEEGRINKDDHIMEIKETNGQDPLVMSHIRKKFINHIFEMFEDLDTSSIKSSTIFRVNVWLRESNPDAYTPMIVSIGPYHKTNPQLGPMKKYKLLYLRRFLQRKKGLDIESCMNQLEKLKEKALKCYGDDIEEDVDDDIDEFCQMLLLDGCFVVEFIRERCGMCPQGEEEIINIAGFICHQIFRDMMLVENQLPFFVLNKLHRMTKKDDELPLTIQVNKVFTFFVDLPKMIRLSFRGTEYCNAGNIKHLLHAVHMLSCHGWSSMKKSNDGITWHKVMPNATGLSEAGVSFTKVRNNKKMSSLFDIKFENGLMTIPSFEIFSYTETFLRNLIAYEQQSSDEQSKYFSDFATLMYHLIDSDKDVNLLSQKGIIVNWIGEDKQVANLFNRLGNGVGVFSTFYYNEECLKAIQYCEKPWSRMRANVMHNYFNKPWARASTVAAIILFILTAIQTILAFTGGVK